MRSRGPPSTPLKGWRLAGVRPAVGSGSPQAGLRRARTRWLEGLSGDGQRLVKASARLTRLHVKYRFTMAYASLIQKRLLTPEELGSVQQVLDGFMQGADWSLRARVEGTRSLARGYDEAGAS